VPLILSKNTIQELHNLAEAFDNGMRIEINTHEKEISISGNQDIGFATSTMSLLRNYSLTYDCDKYGKWTSDSEEMIKELMDDNIILENTQIGKMLDKACDAFEEKHFKIPKKLYSNERKIDPRGDNMRVICRSQSVKY